MILLISMAIAAVAAVLYLIGMVAKSSTLEGMGESLTVGALVGLMAEMLVLSFELSDILAVGVFLGSCTVFLLFYRSGGPGVVYTLSLIVIMFGYLFMGPYSGYLKTYTDKLTGPMEIAIGQISLVGNDLWLIATDPQKYIEKTEMSTVRTDTPTISYPLGVEFKQIDVMPKDVPANQSFYVRVYAVNEGKMPANVVIRAACSNNLCCMEGSCGVSDDTVQIYPPVEEPPLTLQPMEALNFMFEQPFKAITYKKSDVGKEAQVNVSLHYSHSTSSRLSVKVMSTDEIQRIMTDPLAGESLFRSEVSVGKNAPGMLALTVGYQPLFTAAPNVLVVSVVNKRPKGVVILDESTKINISLDPRIGTGLDCSANNEFNCVSEPSMQNATCEIVRANGIDPINPGGYRPITCTFRTVDYVPTSVTGLVTAQMSHYTFQLMEKKGAKITMAWRPLDDSSDGSSEEDSGFGGGDSGGRTGDAITCPVSCCLGPSQRIMYSSPLQSGQAGQEGVYVCSENPGCGCVSSEHPDGCLGECVPGYQCQQGVCYLQ